MHRLVTDRKKNNGKKESLNTKSALRNSIHCLGNGKISFFHFSSIRLKKYASGRYFLWVNKTMQRKVMLTAYSRIVGGWWWCESYVSEGWVADFIDFLSPPSPFFHPHTLYFCLVCSNVSFVFVLWSTFPQFDIIVDK